MNLNDFTESLGLVSLTGDDPELTFEGVYAGDLLSRCMSHVRFGDLWLTIMNNLNVIAVASLTEAAAVLLVEGVTLPEDVLRVAKEKEVPVFSTEKTVYEVCAVLSKSA